MSIVKLNKVAIFSRKEDKNDLVHALQSFGHLHIIESQPNDSASTPSLKLNEALNKSIRYLESSGKRSKQRSPQFNQGLEDDINQLIHEIQNNAEQRRSLGDALEKIQQRESDLGPWGEFDFPELSEIGNQRFWFYILPLKYKETLHSLTLPWIVVHRDHRQLWLVILAENEPADDVLPVARIHTGKDSLVVVRAQRKKIEIELEDLEFERLKLTRHIHFLKRMRARVQDKTHYRETLKACRDLDEFFILEAWIAVDQNPALEELLAQYSAAVLSSEPDKEDQPPSLLHNPPGFAGGEALVNFYQTPAYRSWDPSIILFGSFSLFFAMILADAAYAAVLSVALLFSWPWLTRSKKMKPLRPLLLSLCVCSLVWGVLVGSYFGISPQEKSMLAKLQLLNIQNFDHMMKISILLGLLHIALANIQQAWLWRKTLRLLNHLGWLFLLLGGAFVTLQTQLQTVSKILFISGLLFIFIGAGNANIRSFRGVCVRLLQGLKSLTNVSNAFGDVLSYLRLFALGLASASLAMTFNDLAQSALQKSSGLGLLSALLILLIGHLLNIFLAIVSGVVHGLRLNFIEFNKWALDGEGRPFTAFKKEEYTQ